MMRSLDALTAIAAAAIALACAGTRAEEETQRGLPLHPAVTAADWSKAVEVEIDLADNTYTPQELVLKVRKPYVLRLKNVGGQSHDMAGGNFFHKGVIALRMINSKVGRVTADDIASVYIRPKNETEIWLVPLRTGEYTFVCTVPGHREGGMEGTVRIVD
jgi:uncharacterized cupredoxin-like copper-binding protein